jgi:hypothetical protein
MHSASQIAFKEWAVVCAALATGRQTIILRKGGIHEGREGFRVAHGEFWLLPTYLHQSATSVVPDAAPLLDQVLSAAPAGDRVSIDTYAVVESAQHLTDEKTVMRLAGEHIWSEDTIHQRFHYREPGLFLLTVRVYKTPAAHELIQTPYIAGCRSWVDLPQPLATAGALPVLDDLVFAERLAAVDSRLG